MKSGDDCELGDNRNQVEIPKNISVSYPSYRIPPTPAILIPVHPVPPSLLDTNLSMAILSLTSPTSRRVPDLGHSPHTMSFNPFATLGDIGCRFGHLCGWNNYLGAHTNWLSLENGTLHMYSFCTQSPQRKALHGMMVAGVDCQLHQYLPLWVAY